MITLTMLFLATAAFANDDTVVNPLSPRPGATVPSVYDKVVPLRSTSANSNGTGSPRGADTGSLTRTLNSRRNQYDVAVKGIGGRQGNASGGLYTLTPGRLRSTPGYDSPLLALSGRQSSSRSSNYDNATAPLGLRPGTTVRPEVPASLQRPDRFPKRWNTGSDMVLTRVVSAPAAQPSKRLQARNESTLDRSIRVLKARIETRRRETSRDAIDRRIQRIQARHERRVTATITKLRLNGKLERLAVNSRGRLINAKTGAAASASDLSASTRRGLNRELQRQRKDLNNETKATNKFTKKLSRQLASKQKQAARIAKRAAKKNPKPKSTLRRKK